MAKCFRIHPTDNTAVLLEDALAGDKVDIVGGKGQVSLREDILYGHKVALMDLEKNQPVLKYGILIGHSTVPIRAGQWVHLHNCASDYDERSGTLDLHTGAATDTDYS
jgi:altronate dehydratase small subunit